MSFIKKYNQDTPKYTSSVEDSFHTALLFYSCNCDQAVVPLAKCHLEFFCNFDGICSKRSSLPRRVKVLSYNEKEQQSSWSQHQARNCISSDGWISKRNAAGLQRPRPEISLSVAFRLLISRLPMLKLCLTNVFHDNELFKNRLLYVWLVRDLSTRLLEWGVPSGVSHCRATKPDLYNTYYQL